MIYLRGLTDLYWNLRKRIQRFIRGYAWEDVWNIDAWFIDTLEPMLRHLQKHHHSYPMRYTSEEWEKRLGKMADHLHLMDEWNVEEECFDTDCSEGIIAKSKRIYDIMDKNKEEFLKMFAEDFYDFWD